MASKATVSAMLKSARSLYARNQSLDLQEAGFVYSQSAQTADDYNQYMEVINKQLTATKNPATQLTLTKTATSAWTGFQSAELQRDTIATMTGTGTDQQKLGDLQTFYNKAVAMGDMNNAQNIEQQYLETENQIQTKQVAATDAANKLANAQGTAEFKSGESLMNDLNTITQAFKQGGQKAVSGALKTYIKNNGDQINSMLEAAGQPPLPKGASITVGQLYGGVVQAVNQYYTLASQATQVSDPTTSDSYAQDSIKLAQGKTNIDSPFGSHSASFYVMLSQNPQLEQEAFHEKQSTGSLGEVTHSFEQNTQTGYKIVNGQLMPSFTKPNGAPGDSAANPALTKQQTQYLTNLGFTVGGSKNGVAAGEIGLTGKALHWLDPGLKGGQFTNINTTQNETGIKLFNTPEGMQFTTGDGNLYTLATDQKGLTATYVTNPATGKATMLHGQYGFDPHNNTVAKGVDPKQLAVQAQVQQQKTLAQQQEVTGQAFTSGSLKAGGNLPGSFNALHPNPVTPATSTLVKPPGSPAPSKLPAPPAVKTSQTPISFGINPLAIKPQAPVSRGPTKPAGPSIVSRAGHDVSNAAKSVVHAGGSAIKAIEHFF